MGQGRPTQSRSSGTLGREQQIRAVWLTMKWPDRRAKRANSREEFLISAPKEFLVIQWESLKRRGSFKDPRYAIEAIPGTQRFGIRSKGIM
ncbi:MAG: hypothetical protein DLM70_01400 [Chloroflexi bacterium]|nr:MAG: hypothetical protein DLM70_01400 [Chloroflexota bacterium]